MNAFAKAWRRSRTSAPPTQAEIVRHDAILFLCVLLMLAAGWGVRLLAQEDSARTANLGTGYPAVAYPAAWIPALNPVAAQDGAAEATPIFVARSAGAPSSFNSILRIEALPVLPDDALGALRIRLGLQRAQALDRYRELSAEPVTVLGGREALLTTYAYLADPTRDSGGNGLPVVVEAQDLLFRNENEWLVATFAADASHWEAEAANIALVLQSLDVEQMAP